MRVLETTSRLHAYRQRVQRRGAEKQKVRVFLDCQKLLWGFHTWGCQWYSATRKQRITIKVNKSNSTFRIRAKKLQANQNRRFKDSTRSTCFSKLANIMHDDKNFVHLGCPPPCERLRLRNQWSLRSFAPSVHFWIYLESWWSWESSTYWLEK